MTGIDEAEFSMSEGGCVKWFKQDKGWIVEVTHRTTKTYKNVYFPPSCAKAKYFYKRFHASTN